MSNLSGSSLQRISLVMLVGPLSVFLQRVFRSSLDSDNSSLGAFLVDFFTIVMPMVIVFLIGDATSHLYFALLALAFVIGSLDIAPNLKGGNCWRRWNLTELLQHIEQPRKPFLTAFRTMMMVCACLMTFVRLSSFRFALVWLYSLLTSLSSPESLPRRKIMESASWISAWEALCSL